MNYHSTASITQTQKKSGNMFANNTVNKFPSIDKYGSGIKTFLSIFYSKIFQNVKLILFKIF